MSSPLALDYENSAKDYLEQLMAGFSQSLASFLCDQEYSGINAQRLSLRLIVSGENADSPHGGPRLPFIVLAIKAQAFDWPSWYVKYPFGVSNEGQERQQSLLLALGQVVYRLWPLPPWMGLGASVGLGRLVTVYGAACDIIVRWCASADICEGIWPFIRLLLSPSVVTELSRTGFPLSSH